MSKRANADPAPAPASLSTLDRDGEHLAQGESAALRKLVESVKDHAIFMLDPLGNVVSWNAGAESVLGWSAEEIIGEHVARFFPEDGSLGAPALALRVAERDGRSEAEGWQVRKDGSRFPATVVITAVHAKGGELVGFANVTRDLTEQKRAEEERLRLAQAQEANRMKDEFLATVSHELRTPLTAILGWSHVLKGRVTEPLMSKAVETIRRNALAQARLIDDILDVSRIITGKMRIEARNIELSSIVRDAIEVVRPAADARGLQLDVDLGTESVMLLGDATRLQQVVWNLLSNAVKFTDAGTISIRVEREGSTVRLCVKDTGRGINPEFLPHVFESFRQADATTTRSIGGLGLGLAIVRHIVELHGGTTSVESDGLGLGARFQVILPVRAILIDTPPERDSREHIAPPSGRLVGIRVLVVDDEKDACELLETVLESQGAIVRTANSAEEGRKVLLEMKPHVLVSDVGMPGEDGYNFIRTVRRIGRANGGALPAIALTAYVRSEDRLRAFDAGFNNFLAKPVDAEEFIRVVRNSADIAQIEPSL